MRYFIPYWRLVCLAMLIAPCSWAQGTLVPPTDKQSRYSEPNPSPGASKLSAAAKLSSAGGQFIQDVTISILIERSLDNLESDVADTLSKTGLRGALLSAEVATTRGEIDQHTLVTGGLRFIGVGSSPTNVYIFSKVHPSITQSPPGGSTLNLDRSFFLWVDRGPAEKQRCYLFFECMKMGDFRVKIISARGLFSLDAQSQSDQILFQNQKDIARYETLESIISHMESDTNDKSIKAKTAEIYKNARETKEKMDQIDADLRKELERSARAQQASMNLQLVANVLTLGQQIYTVYNSLGGDAPNSPTDIKKTDDLQSIINDISQKSIENRSNLDIKYNIYKDQLRGIQLDQIELLRLQKIPINRIPELTPN